MPRSFLPSLVTYAGLAAGFVLLAAATELETLIASILRCSHTQEVDAVGNPGIGV